MEKKQDKSVEQDYKIQNQYIKINNVKPDNEIKITISSTITSSSIKQLMANFTQEVQCFLHRKLQTLLKDIKDLNKWETIPSSWI